MPYNLSRFMLPLAMLGLCLPQTTNAICPLTCTSSTYSSTTTSKLFPDKDLVCNEDDTRGGVTFTVSQLNGGDFDIQGSVICHEVYNQYSAMEAGTVVPNTEGSFDIVQSAMSPTMETDVGLLLETTNTDPETGLNLVSWIFQVDSTGGTKEIYRTKLVPADALTIERYCYDQDNNPVAPENCWLNQGTEPNPTASDHPETTIDGITLLEGQAWRMDFLETDGQLIAKKYVMNLCHGLSFYGLVDEPVCETKGKTKLALRSQASATVLIGIDVTFNPDVVNRNDTGDTFTVVLLSEPGFNPATVDQASVLIKDSGGTDTVPLTCSTLLDKNGDSVDELVCTTTIGALNSLSDVASFEPGPGVLPTVTLNVTADSTVGDTHFSGSKAITIELQAAVDFRAGCGNNLAVNNPSLQSTQKVTVNGGYWGTWCSGDDAPCDLTTATQINTSMTKFVFEGGDVALTLDTGTYENGLVDASGGECGSDGWDGTPDGTTDQLYYFSTMELIDKAGLASCIDGETYQLPVVGQFSNGTPWASNATITCQNNN